MNYIKELSQFVIRTKQWWLIPVIILLLLVGIFVVFADSAIAPFIYTLF